MTKEKIIGTVLLAIGVLAFMDALAPIDLFAYHIRLFLFPALAVLSGWFILHGPGPLHRKAHHSHVLGLLSLVTIALALVWYLHVHSHK